MATNKTNNKNSIDINFLNNPLIFKWIGIAAGELLVVLILVFVVVIPRFEATTVLWGQIKEQSDLVRNLQSKSEELDQFKVDFAPKQSLIDQAIPNDKDVGLMMASLRQVADQSGVAITDYKLNPGSVKGQTTTKTAGVGNWLEIEATVTGAEGAMQTFLKTLDKSLPIKLVKNLEVTSKTIQGSEGSTSQLPQIRLLLWAYYLDSGSKASAQSLLKQLDDNDLQVLTDLGGFARVQTASSSGGALNPTGDLFGLTPQ